MRRTVIERIFGCQDCKFADKHQCSVCAFFAPVSSHTEMYYGWNLTITTEEMQNYTKARISKFSRRKEKDGFQIIPLLYLSQRSIVYKVLKISMKQKKTVNQRKSDKYFKKWSKKVSSFFFYHSLNMDGGRLLS